MIRASHPRQDSGSGHRGSFASRWVRAVIGSSPTMRFRRHTRLPVDFASLGLLLSSCAVAPPLAAAPQTRPRDIAKYIPAAQGLYQALHEHPELSGQEHATAERLSKRLGALGFEVTAKVGGTGIVALFRNGPGKTLMMRTDLDALPVKEETGLAFASQCEAVGPEGVRVSVMHACGHDLHMAAWVATAEYLVDHQGLWSGTLMMVGQPAEETLSGARAMLADGLFERFPRPDVAFAIHVHDQLPVGQVGYTVGPYGASADSVDITVFGRGGHGAYPHATVDPVVIASRIVLALQTIVSRESDPQEPVVVSVGSIHGGTKHNVIPESVALQLTVRTYSPESRKRVLSSIERIASAEAQAAAAPRAPQVTVTAGTTVAVNDPEQTLRAVEAVRRVPELSQVIEIPPEMGSEDFAEYGQAGVPSVMLNLGVAEPTHYEASKAGGAPLPSIHSSLFVPSMPDALRLAILVETEVALELLGSR